MPTPKLTNEILTAAIEGYESQKKRIDAQIAELRAILSPGPAETATTPEPATRKRKKFSAASRRKMALAQKARWAKIRGEAESSAPATPKATKPKRRISREGLARIIAATKKRWRLQKAAAKAATKKPAPARKKAAVKKAAARTAPAKAAKKAPAKKDATAPKQGGAQSGRRGQAQAHHSGHGENQGHAKVRKPRGISRVSQALDRCQPPARHSGHG